MQRTHILEGNREAKGETTLWSVISFFSSPFGKYPPKKEKKQTDGLYTRNSREHELLRITHA